MITQENRGHSVLTRRETEGRVARSISEDFRRNGRGTQQVYIPPALQPSPGKGPVVLHLWGTTLLTQNERKMGNSKQECCAEHKPYNFRKGCVSKVSFYQVHIVGTSLSNEESAQCFLTSLHRRGLGRWRPIRHQAVYEFINLIHCQSILPALEMQHTTLWFTSTSLSNMWLRISRREVDLWQYIPHWGQLSGRRGRTVRGSDAVN